MTVTTSQSITVYRVGRAVHPLFDGTGAARFGARWTSPGHSAIYAAGSYAGALLEVLVHAQRPNLKSQYHCLVIHIPAGIPIFEVQPDIAPGWEASNYVVSRAWGDTWLEKQEAAVMCVPSMIGRPHERNYIINPAHQDTGKLRFEEPHPVVWDERLIT